MNENEWLANRFEANRPHLRAVAYRMLGSTAEADDAVQESWLRLRSTDPHSIQNLGGWLTTVVARVCLDVLRSRRSRNEEPLPIHAPDPKSGPEHEALLSDSVGEALLVVLGTLAPAERVAFVLHDMFDFSFDDIAPIVDRSTEATRQLASRARRRVRGVEALVEVDLTRQREIVDAFRAASRSGDLEALIYLLDPDVILRADAVAAQLGAVAELRGAAAVAGNFSGRAQGALPALVAGAAGLAWAPGGQLRVAFRFTVEHGKIVAIDLVADPATLKEFNVSISANP